MFGEEGGRNRCDENVLSEVCITHLGGKPMVELEELCCSYSMRQLLLKKALVESNLADFRSCFFFLPFVHGDRANLPCEWRLEAW